MTIAADPGLYRSEAFAEDLFELPLDQGSQRGAAAASWWIHLVPAAVALLGVAFAVLPPLA